jgi:hypothetical protein
LRFTRAAVKQSVKQDRAEGGRPDAAKGKAAQRQSKIAGPAPA